MATMTAAPLTTSGVARRLRRCETTVRNLVRSGRLQPAMTTETGVRLYDPLDVDRLARELERKSEA
jgi:DNA-binding transcriptional MerR regulator